MNLYRGKTRIKAIYQGDKILPCVKINKKINQGVIQCTLPGVGNDIILNYKQENQCRGHKTYYKKYINTNILIGNNCIVSECKIKSGISIYVQDRGKLNAVILRNVVLELNNAGTVSNILAKQKTRISSQDSNLDNIQLEESSSLTTSGANNIDTLIIHKNASAYIQGFSTISNVTVKKGGELYIGKDVTLLEDIKAQQGATINYQEEGQII